MSDLESGAAPDIHIVAGPGTLPCTADFMDRRPALRRLVSIGSGCEGFDRRAAAARSIEIATGATPENVEGMASATIMLMLALLHDLDGARRASATCSRRDTSRARSLTEVCVGIIGYGAIGREVTRKLRAWDVAVVLFAPSLTPGVLDNGAVAVDLDRLLRTSDVVSLHAALAPSSRHLLDHARIARMKAGSVLVNTARGELIDEAALAEALREGRLAGAALDCFETEPLPEGSVLRSLDNVILTPHQIGHTRAGSESVVEALIQNIVRPLPPRHV